MKYKTDIKGNRAIYILDLMRAFEEKYGCSDSGCYSNRGGWFSPEAILNLMSEFAKTHVYDN